MNKNNISKLSEYIKEYKGINSPLGWITINVSECIGQGGNGIVYAGKINTVDIAVKFLVNYTSKKLERFKAEYLNVNIKKDQLVNVVNCIEYAILNIEDFEIPYIIMKRYKCGLDKYRKQLEEITWEQVEKLFKALSESLISLEKSKIIHRDLKPENILVDDDDRFIISDFGIAHFDAEDFPIVGLTTKGDRLANLKFSAPEQLVGTNVTFATDIYSFAQILYWFAFGEVNRGTGGKHLNQIYENKDATYLDNIIYKCLNNNPDDRPQNIEEILSAINNMRVSARDINPFDDMYQLSRIVRSTIPELYNHVGFTEDSKEISELIRKLNTCKTNRPFEFNTGISNNTISIFEELENGNYLLNSREIRIVRIWGIVTDSAYDDLLILVVSEPEPYTIDGEKYYGVAVINNEDIIPVDKIPAGYIRYRGEVCSVSDLKIQERYIYPNEKEKYFTIGAFHQCSIISKNDQYIEQIQEFDNLNEKILIELKRKISRNRTHDVTIYL